MIYGEDLTTTAQDAKGNDVADGFAGGVLYHHSSKEVVAIGAGAP